MKPRKRGGPGPLGAVAWPTGGRCLTQWGPLLGPLWAVAWPTGGCCLAHWGLLLGPLGAVAWPNGGRCLAHCGCCLAHWGLLLGPLGAVEPWEKEVYFVAFKMKHCNNAHSTSPCPYVCPSACNNSRSAEKKFTKIVSFPFLVQTFQQPLHLTTHK